MQTKKILMAAASLMMLGANIAAAQPAWVPPGNDPNGYYSQNDHNGYYDRDGHYARIQDRGYRDRGYGPPPPPSPPPAATISRAAMSRIAGAATRRQARFSAPLRAA